jgi:hypothetical protein
MLTRLAVKATKVIGASGVAFAAWYVVSGPRATR